MTAASKKAWRPPLIVSTTLSPSARITASEIGTSMFSRRLRMDAKADV